MAAVEISRTQVPRRQVLAAAVMMVCLAGGISALAQPDLVDMAVVDRDSGEPLQVWRHDGRLFIAGEPGRRYAVRVTNRTGRRVLAVMSVDGVNILTGQTAGYDQRGYVLEAYQSYDATGWRKSDDEVAAFSFAPLPQSYAARTGRPGDVGVIGMAVFQERAFLEPLHAEPPPPPPIHRFITPLGAPPPPPLAAPVPAPNTSVNEAVVTGSRIARGGFNAPSPQEKLGTAHGDREWSEAHTVSFVRATPYPQTIRQIEYDSYDNLLASGVIPRGRDKTPPPRAFPSPPHGEGYVPDPPDDR